MLGDEMLTIALTFFFSIVVLITVGTILFMRRYPLRIHVNRPAPPPEPAQAEPVIHKKGYQPKMGEKVLYLSLGKQWCVGRVVDHGGSMFLVRRGHHSFWKYSDQIRKRHLAENIRPEAVMSAYA